MCAKSEDSLLAILGSAVAPIFKPLGFADWRISTSLITGFAAKESVVSTLTVLLGGDTSLLPTLFTKSTAAVFFGIFSPLYAVRRRHCRSQKRTGCKVGGFGVHNSVRHSVDCCVFCAHGTFIYLGNGDSNPHWFHIAIFPVTAVNPLKILTPVKADKSEGFVKIQSTGNAGSSPRCLSLKICILTVFSKNQPYAVYFKINGIPLFKNIFIF